MRRLLSVAVALLAAGPLWAGGQPASHADMFDHYEGTSTCLECHEEEAIDVFHSQHYQWKGDASAVVNSHGKKLGKINTMNDFCTNPLPNWIGVVRNSDGKVLSKGCSKCHAGFGKLPSEEMTREQLENIDCLICHVPGYQRDLTQDAQGNDVWAPTLLIRARQMEKKNPKVAERMFAGMDKVAQKITLPKRQMCLRCHAGSGGGPNFKRGDIEYEMADCTRDFDVHMGADGQDMACIDCHEGDGHHMSGRGADLWGSGAGGWLRCTKCHEEAPHGKKVLDHHAKRIACQTCHIPTFANADATDMVRDWSKPFFHADKKKWTGTVTMQDHVVPQYRWFNGKSRGQLLGEKVRRRKSDGVVVMMEPQGDKKDKEARIYPFKVHRATLPLLKKEQWLIPIAVEEFFADGDMAKAVAEGAEVTYGIEDPDYEWVWAERWMSINHEVRPADHALQCLDCHSENGRLDWQALGYKEDPVLKRMK